MPRSVPLLTARRRRVVPPATKRVAIPKTGPGPARGRIKPSSWSPTRELFFFHAPAAGRLRKVDGTEPRSRDRRAGRPPCGGPNWEPGEKTLLGFEVPLFYRVRQEPLRATGGVMRESFRARSGVLPFCSHAHSLSGASRRGAIKRIWRVQLTPPTSFAHRYVRQDAHYDPACPH